jgi:hypothetical protein
MGLGPVQAVHTNLLVAVPSARAHLASITAII